MVDKAPSAAALSNPDSLRPTSAITTSRAMTVEAPLANKATAHFMAMRLRASGGSSARAFGLLGSKPRGVEAQGLDLGAVGLADRRLAGETGPGDPGPETARPAEPLGGGHAHDADGGPGDADGRDGQPGRDEEVHGFGARLQQLGGVAA